MSTHISFLQMPEVPMEYILKYLDFPSILVLRKVCHDLRKFIDDTKPASRLTKIYLGMDAESISFKLCLPRPHFWLCIDYMKTREGCLVKCDGKVKEKILENEDFVTGFCKDFNIVLRHQKPVLEAFYIEFDSLDSTTKKRILESINKFFKSSNHPLQVKSLYMTVSNHDEVLSILPYIDPKPLKKIYINEPSRKFNVVLNLHEIGLLEQWKQADDLSIYGFQLPHPIQNLKHFLRITLHLREVSAEVLISLKEMFLCSSTLILMIIYNYGNISQAIISQQLIESFGHPFVDSDQERNWFFRTSNTNQLLRIKMIYNEINFKPIEQSDVPQNAIILN